MVGLDDKRKKLDLNGSKPIILYLVGVNSNPLQMTCLTRPYRAGTTDMPLQLEMMPQSTSYEGP